MWLHAHEHLCLYLFFLLVLPASCPFHELMRGKMERYVVLPFSVGCASYSSIAVCDNQPKKTKEESNPSAHGDQLSGEEMKNSLGFLPIQKPNISSGLHRLMKGFKSFSQIFGE